MSCGFHLFFFTSFGWTLDMVVWLILLACCLLECDAAGDWSYTGSHGPSHWADTYTKCGGENQSPIDISKTHYNDTLGQISFTGYDVKPRALTLSNNGHSVVVTVDGSMTIAAGGLRDTYKLEQFHFHWGSSRHQGSEHTYHGHAYDAELHFVHHKSSHAGVAEAAPQEPDGLAVLGVFIQVEQYDNPGFQNIVNELSKVTYKDAKVSIEPFPLSKMLPDDTTSYVRYQGGLTTPPCHESVQWTVFSTPVRMSRVQMDKFRKLMSGASGDSGNEKIMDNYRPPQPLNDRIVYASQQNLPTAGANHVTTTVITTSFTLLATIVLQGNIVA